MVDGLDHVGTSISALTNEYHTIAHNIANINTAGYKRKVNMFSRELMNHIGENSNNGVELPASQVKSKAAIDFSQGSLVRTDRPLDLALVGKGFFVVETPEGPLYTRNGIFHLNAQGQLVNLTGRLVGGVDAPITAPPNVSEMSIQISEDGRVRADGVVLGQLRIVDFGADEDKLVCVGENCYAVGPDVQPRAADKAVVRQGYQENSNVKVTSELVDLISVSRLYETNMNILRKRAENSRTILSVANG
ncbi:MAG TPA: flagellar hook basal-body protein [Anaerohalosphaeraceae bacterium]|jgi:flagellar basal-body rod protein FlgF|nr:flagellar hook basal-body protein [Anaerohalosphaeraceae bacterium]HRT49471.1 flagellar hook basal-body protein [Anaerohalosphaeraceae bacterium]HRT85365.1 flagellar hook basal-body protein [Anaerohalosphaeraceae bacterium]